MVINEYALANWLVPDRADFAPCVDGSASRANPCQVARDVVAVVGECDSDVSWSVPIPCKVDRVMRTHGADGRLVSRRFSTVGGEITAYPRSGGVLLPGTMFIVDLDSNARIGLAGTFLQRERRETAQADWRSISTLDPHPMLKRQYWI